MAAFFRHAPCIKAAMKIIVKDLLALQRLQLNPQAPTEASRAEIEKLRKKVPAPILAHYERFVARGKKGVSIARNGVCTECHLRMTTGKLLSLADANEVHLCDNCGRYLYLPEEAPVAAIDLKPLPAETTAPVKRRSRKVPSVVL